MPLKTKLFFIFSITFLIFAIVAFSLRFYTEQLEDEQKRKAMSANILEGITAEPTTVTVDYSQKVSTGSPLVFGGSHGPLPKDIQVWNDLKNIGVTLIRKDLFPEDSLPKNITLDQYKKNVNNVQNPDTWNKDNIQSINQYFSLAKERGMKTMGIMSYSPAWLTYSGSIYGLPKDWDVYKDIVKKIYKIHRSELDYLEIWNEPNYSFYMNLKNTPYSSTEAYKLIFKNASEAVREVDAEANDGKRISIGGPVSYNPTDTDNLEALLSDPSTRSNLDFVSYHNYEQVDEPSWNLYKQVLEKYSSNLPIFISEWNHQPNDNTPDPFNSSLVALPYTGKKFISYLNMGLYGAAYHVLEPVNNRKPDNGDGYYGFYQVINGTYQLRPQAKSWTLMSTSMGLGKGTSTIVQSSSSDSITSLGFKNVYSTKGAVIVNDSEDSKLVEFDLHNSDIKKRAHVVAYLASVDNDGSTPFDSRLAYPENGILKLRYVIPGNSILGIQIQEETEWYDVLNSLKLN